MVKNAKCPKEKGANCKRGQCTIYGTKYCQDGMPQPGKCTIRPCTQRCMVWGTDFCKSGEIRSVKSGLDLGGLVDGLNPEKMIEKLDPTSMLDKFKK